jgi:hypothetical protein
MEWVAMFGGLSCGVVVIMGVMAALILALVLGMGGLFRNVSGWDELSRRFPGPSVPPVFLQSGSIRLGNVFYRYGTRFGPMQEGLYLAFKGAYRNPPVLIPWHELRNPQASILYWQPAWRLDVGQPLITRLTVKEAQYQWMKPYLEK